MQAELPTARRSEVRVAAGRAYICWIATEKPDSSNSFSENTTFPSGPTSTLHGTQPFVSARNSVPSPSEITGKVRPNSSFQARQASSVSKAPM